MFEIDILWLTKRLQMVRDLLVHGASSMVLSGKAKLFAFSWKSSRKEGAGCAIQSLLFQGYL